MLPRPSRGGLGGSISGGLHGQRRTDLDGDGWIDIPGYDRWSIRPRLFFDGVNGAKLFATLGAMGEDRRGGTLPGRTVPDGTEYRQEQRTDRLDAGLTGELPVDGVGTVSVRASAMAQKHRHRFGDVIENDRHRTFFAETSLSGGSKRTPWIAGLAYQRDTYRNRAFPAFDYAFDVPAMFGQVEHEVSDALTLAGSARADFHSDYGTQLSPRLSMLYRQGPWKVRASLGRGFYAPTPFVEETEAAGLSRLEPLGDLDAETARTASVDVGYTRGRIESSITLFAANIRNSTRLVPGLAPDRVRLVNVESPTRIRGSEVLLRYRLREFTLTGSYVYVDATEADDAATNRVRVPLTPRHTAGLVGMWEDHDKGRIGVEVYYTGRQRLEDNPYRATSRPYLPARAARRSRRQPPPQGLRQCRESARHPPDPLRSARPAGAAGGRTLDGRRLGADRRLHPQWRDPGRPRRQTLEATLSIWSRLAASQESARDAHSLPAGERKAGARPFTDNCTTCDGLVRSGEGERSPSRPMGAQGHIFPALAPPSAPQLNASESSSAG